MQAISDGNVSFLRELAAKSVPLETKSPSSGHTPLEAACLKTDADAVESLIRSVKKDRKRSASIRINMNEFLPLKIRCKSEGGIRRSKISSGIRRLFG